MLSPSLGGGVREGSLEEEVWGPNQEDPLLFVWSVGFVRRFMARAQPGVWHGDAQHVLTGG